MVQYNTTPAPGDVIANSQSILLANSQYLQTSVGIDHNFTNNTATSQDGYHKVIHFVNQGADPAPATNAGELYTKTYAETGEQELFFQTPSGVVSQLTGSDQATNGYAWFGGLLVQWGQITSTSSSFTTLTFSTANIAFPNNCFAIFTQPYGSGTEPSSQATVEIRKSTISKTSFQWCYVTNSSQYTGFFWVAIGN